MGGPTQRPYLPIFETQRFNFHDDEDDDLMDDKDLGDDSGDLPGPINALSKHEIHTVPTANGSNEKSKRGFVTHYLISLDE